MPQFFDSSFSQTNPTLNEEESHHCVSVLRFRTGDPIKIINGQGAFYQGIINSANKKACGVDIEEYKDYSHLKPKSIIGIAPVKSNDRIEWFVEKACEIGVGKIIFLETRRSVRSKLNFERIQKKAIGALKQSENLFLPEFVGMVNVEKVNKIIPENYNRYVAHLSDQATIMSSSDECAILIGPEGGFEDFEVEKLNDEGFGSLKLGNSILRTETAGVIAAYLMQMP